MRQLKTFEVLHETASGIVAVTVLKATTKRAALARFRRLVTSRRYSGSMMFFPETEDFRFRGQRPVMATVEIFDQSKLTVLG